MEPPDWMEGLSNLVDWQEENKGMPQSLIEHHVRSSESEIWIRKSELELPVFNHIVSYQSSPMLIFEDFCFHFDYWARLVGAHKHASVRSHDTQEYESVHAIYR
ncbi:hypothetical protein TNCV_2716151 [Trichonephila clavipes]|nr:hypothetical protein TNCV_2716151 [Trichonephila clavipes]